MDITNLMIDMSLFAMLEADASLKLPQPQLRQNGMSLDHALMKRRSVREFNTTIPVSLQMISNLLWAACGVNRPDEGKLTSPTAMNTHEVTAYLLDSEGAYMYIPKTNRLKAVNSGDMRRLAAGTETFSQEFVTEAPICIVLVADYGKFELPEESARRMAAIDCGFASENICLYCAANGLATVPRATMDVDALAKALHLTQRQVPVLNNPVGYAAQ